MKKAVLVLTLLVISLGATAQDAKALLGEVSKKIKSHKNIVLDFKYSLMNTAEDINQETRGYLTVADEKYHLNLMGITQLYDGTSLHVIIPEDEEINISKPDPSSEESVTPSKMLTFFEEGFTYKWDATQDVKGRNIQYIKLIPIDNSKDDSKEILMGVDTRTKHIYKVIRKQHNGTQVDITINSIKTDQPLSETLFKFDTAKYENYYINRIE